MDHGHNGSFTEASAVPAASLPRSASVPSSAQADPSQVGTPPEAGVTVSIAPLPDLTTTAAGEPLLYPSTPDPVIKSYILTIPPGGVTRWMTHPVPAYLFVLQGDLTVQFFTGRQETFHAEQAFLQACTEWHRGRNDGQQPVRFLAVFLDAKGIPTILHPPATA